MANIYERANIRAGDPIGEAAIGGQKASTYFNRYQKEKQNLRNINEVLADAGAIHGKRATKKTQRGLMNSLLAAAVGEAIMAMVNAGASTTTTPARIASWVGPTVGAVTQGLGASATQDWLDKRYDATKGLKELKKDYKKGTKRYADIDRAKRLYGDAQEQAKMMDIAISTIGGGISGAGDLTEAASTNAFDLLDEKAKQKAIKEGTDKSLRETVVQQATVQPRFLGLEVDDISNWMRDALKIEKGTGPVFGQAATIPTKAIGEKANLLDILAGMVPGGEKLVSGVGGFMDDAPFLEDLIKYTAPTLASSALTPKPVFDPLYSEGFKNPYGRRI